MKKRFTEERIVRMLPEAEASALQVREFCRKQNITEQTFFRRRNEYGGMDVSDARRFDVPGSFGHRIQWPAVPDSYRTS